MKVRHCRTVLLAALVAVAALAATLPAPALATSGAATLRSHIGAVLNKFHLADPSTGIMVWDESSGRALYGYNATAPLVPASNTKLATSAAAMARLGGDYRFKTELYASTLPLLPPYGIGEIVGDVFVKGYGDPSISTRAFQDKVLRFPTTRLESFVARLKAMGVTRITGGVVVDDSYFDRVRSCPGWLPSFVKTQLGTLSALSLNENTSVFGPLMSPPVYVGATLTRLLKQAGVAVGKGPRVATVAPGSVLVGTLYSAPLSMLLRHMNKTSDNFYAEMLVKALGAELRGSGTTAAGLSVTRSYLTMAGIGGSSYKLYDGSGLSYLNRFSAAALVRLLRAQSDYTYSAAFADSLSIAGVDGTLRRRMRSTAAQKRVLAKTGSLAIASCLSGYVSSLGGHTLAFSMLMNGSPLSYASATHAQNDVAELLAAMRRY